MKPREYVADDGTLIYCSDIITAVRCPYTEKLVGTTDICTFCKNRYKENDYWMYCLRPKEETENEET